MKPPPPWPFWALCTLALVVGVVQGLVPAMLLLIFTELIEIERAIRNTRQEQRANGEG